MFLATGAETVPPYCVTPLGLSIATYTTYSGLSAGKNHNVKKKINLRATNVVRRLFQGEMSYPNLPKS